MLLSPGEEARVGTRQMLSMMVAKYLLIGVRGQAGQLAGLARLAASSLHWGLTAGRTDSLVVAAAKLAEKELEGEVVGLLQVGLWAGTLEHYEGVRKGSGEGRQWCGQGDNDLLL